MRPRRPTVVPVSRDYRRSPRWGMGLPPQRPRRWWQRLADPLFYLRAVIAVAAIALLIVPMLADGALAVARPISVGTAKCRILQVVDGDTVNLWCDKTGFEKARLVGFDTPELFSPKCAAEAIAAQNAKWALRATLLSGKSLRMERGKLDRYGRRLVTIRVNGAALSDLMIKSGNARAYGGAARQGWCD